MSGTPTASGSVPVLTRHNRIGVDSNVFVFATHPPTVERIRLAEWWLAKK